MSKDIEFIENEKMTILKDGKEVECDILFSFVSEDTECVYIGYTDHSFTNGRKNIFVSKFNPMTDAGLTAITDPDELEMVQEVLKEIDEECNES